MWTPLTPLVELSKLQSTRDTFKRHGWRVDRALHNWIYFVFYRHYVTVALHTSQKVVDKLTWFKPLKYVGRMVFDRYHAKVLSFGDVEKILTLDKDLHLGPDQAKQIIPFKYANSIIFKEPTMIAVMDCPCKQARNAPCRPAAACIAIGQDFAPLWLEHCKHNNARLISQEEALDTIRTLRDSGHVTQAFLKVATGGVTGVICNCCPDCCVSLEASRITRKIDPGLAQSAASGYLVDHDPTKCTACGRCEAICPFDAVSLADGTYSYKASQCMGCDLCVERCPENALSLYVDDQSEVLPLDLDLAKRKLAG